VHLIAVQRGVNHLTGDGTEQKKVTVDTTITARTSDAFAGESHIPLLVNALNGLADYPVLFHSLAVERV
jgi:hypothetical protein